MGRRGRAFVESDALRGYRPECGDVHRQRRCQSVYNVLNTIYGSSGNPYYFDNQAYPFYFSMPAPQTNVIPAYCAPVDGWAFGSTYPPNTTSAFSNGVGFIFAARPKGFDCGAGHSELNDLNLEIWAYGANVTDGQGGSDQASKLTWSYNDLLIDGLGQAESSEGPVMPVTASIIAFTNAADYVYCAGDATYAYPHDTFPFSGDPAGWLIPQQYANLLALGPLGFVTKVQRHVLFEHRQYFVLYDDLATTTPANFEWVYHVFRDSVQNLSSGGSFNYSVVPAARSYPWSNINVYVYQVVNPSLLGTTNMYLTNAYSNPLTGENYYSSAYADSPDGGQGVANPLMTNSIWVTNMVPTNQFHFMTVIFPVAPGGSAPTITRVDDQTVNVVYGTNNDVITFNPNMASGYTLKVNSPFVASSASPVPPQPTPLYTNATVQSGGGGGGGPTVLLPPSNVHVIPPGATNLIAMGTAPAPAFTPPAGYSAWWDPDTLSGQSQAPVASWTDRSAGAWTLTQGVLVRQPTLLPDAQNGHNCLSFNGVQDSQYMGVLLTQPCEIFVVAQMATAGAAGPSFLLGDDHVSASLEIGTVGGQYCVNFGNTIAGGTVGTNWFEFTAILSGANTQLFANGVLVTNCSINSAAGMNGICIGSYDNGGYGQSWVGNIGDVLIYTNVLPTASQQVVETGLRTKYGF